MQCAQKSAKLVIKNHKNNIITIILLLRLACSCCPLKKQKMRLCEKEAHP